MTTNDLIEKHLDAFVDWIHETKDEFITFDDRYEEDLENYIAENKEELWSEYSKQLPEA